MAAPSRKPSPMAEPTTASVQPGDPAHGTNVASDVVSNAVEVIAPVISMQRSNGSTPPIGNADKGYRWAQLVSDLLTPDYLETLTGTLRDYSSLPDTVTLQLFQYLVSVYQHRLAQEIETGGIDSIDTSLPHFKLSLGRRKGGQKLELIIDSEKTKSYLKSSLAEFFNHAGFKEEFARAIGANLVIWSLEDIEREQGTELFQQLSLDRLRELSDAYLQDPNSPALQEKISFFGQIYCQDITQKIIDGFNLPNCTLHDIEKILGLKQRPPTETETSLTLDPIAVVPTCIPIASSIRAQLRPDLWQRDDDELAVFQYRSRINPANYIEHYITNPGDIAMLPWEAAEQIINKFGFDTVKLQLIFAAQTMDQGEPWKSTFTLRATDIIQLLGWDKNHNTNMPEKRNAVASTAYALSCLLVKSVWVEGRGKRQIDASTPIGRMWDVLIDPHGQIDWVTGKIEKPEEVYITISPGLWTKHFLNRAGSRAKEALHQFGYLAKDILKIDPYHNEMALRLAIQLTLDARIRARNQNPYDYRVISLLDEVLPKAEVDRALRNKYKARDLKNRWNKALKLLMSLGWRIEFDPETYPDWLQPGSKAPKPPDWRKVKVIERLLQAKLTIKPPHPIPDLLEKVREPKRPKPITPAAPTESLTGDVMKSARQNQGWSRKELGGFLGVSADYIGKLERGDRFITPELDTKLRKLLHL
jgi:hypothetical protein